MKLEHNFTVAAPVEQAWALLLDVERIAPCMPGATLTSFSDEDFEGNVKVKLGPVNMTYAGKGRFLERDESAHRVVIVASGRDARGGGTAKATVTGLLTAAEDGSSTTVSVVTDLAVTGRPAQFGRGMIADVGGRLIGQFANCLAAKIRELPAAAAASVTAAADVSAPAGPDADAAGAGSPGAAVPAAGPPAEEPVTADTVAADVSAPAGPPADAAAPAAPAEDAVTTDVPARETPASPDETGPSTAAPSTAAPSAATAPAAASPADLASTRTVLSPPATPVEPIDLLQVSGVSSMARKVAPYVIGFVAGGLVTWGLLTWLG